MPSRFVEPLDFKSIYVDYFLGSESLFPFLFVIIFSFVSATLRMSNKIFLILLGLGSLMFGAYMGQAIYVLVLFIIGVISFKGLSKLLQ